MITGMVRVRIDDHLRVLKADLPPGHEDAIKQRLTIPNGARVAAIKRNQWGARDWPTHIMLYEDEGPYLVMPRGYAQELRFGIEASGYEFSWDDQTSAPSLPLLELVQQGPNLHPDQERACHAILNYRQGVLQAPTGAGKTVVVLEAWRRSGVRGLILTEKAGLARQWRERAQEHLGIEAGMIGDGEWDEKPLTIAIMQTLRRRELVEGWWELWGFVSVDECHHAVADTYSQLIENVCSRWFVGKTATPLEREWTQPLLTRRIGPIIHITTDEELRRSGRKVTPLIQRINTGFKWVRQSERDKALVDTKVIYRRIIAALKEDRARVAKIVENIMAQQIECAQLVTADQLGYLDLIEAGLFMSGYEGDIYMMRGAEGLDRREEIARLADAGRCVILSTVADEGTDIPRLDRLHLTWPGKLDRVLQQKVGRVLRTHPDKRETIIFDYVDDEGMLLNQARLRMNFYRRAGYPVEQERVHAT
jgi:superfamily II DNA or RNA helicase